MKVYIVHGCSGHFNNQVLDVFNTYEKAVDYAIKTSRELFDEYNVPANCREVVFLEDTETVSYNGAKLAIMDKRYQIEIYVNEHEVQ